MGLASLPGGPGLFSACAVPGRRARAAGARLGRRRGAAAQRRVRPAGGGLAVASMILTVAFYALLVFGYFYVDRRRCGRGASEFDGERPARRSGPSARRCGAGVGRALPVQGACVLVLIGGGIAGDLVGEATPGLRHRDERSASSACSGMFLLALPDHVLQPPPLPRPAAPARRARRGRRVALRRAARPIASLGAVLPGPPHQRRRDRGGGPARRCGARCSRSRTSSSRSSRRTPTSRPPRARSPRGGRCGSRRCRSATARSATRPTARRSTASASPRSA